MRRRFDLRHPSDTRLREWLDSSLSSDVSDHVEQCERCADRLEQLDGPVAGGAPSALRQGLAEAFRPPEDLNQRVLRGIEARRRAEDEIALFAGLFTIGVETAKLMMGGDRPATPDGDQRNNPPGAAQLGDEDDQRGESPT